MNAFVAMRKSISQLHTLIQRMDGMELKQMQTDKQLEKLFSVLENRVEKKQGIFFGGQLFDAHVFVSKLVRGATKSILLIDNYVNETTLLLLSKRKKGVTCKIHTRITPSLRSDLIKHNEQYPEIIMLENKKSHDRFLIIDENKLFHFGASLKDLGKKCFAFSRMDEFLPEIRGKLLKE